VNTKLKCVLLDDEIPGLSYLKMLCEQLPALEVVKAFSNPVKFLEEIPRLDFDLCILDIEMPQMTGLQVAALIKDKLVIFTTAYREYAAEAFDLNAVDYVRKPVQKERLQDAVKKALDRQLAKAPLRDFIQLNSSQGKTLLHFDKIAYITTSETDSRDKIAVLLENRTVTLKNISFEFLSRNLPASVFCRINKKEMISIKIIVSYSYDEIVTSLIGEQGRPVKLALSEVYRQDFLVIANPLS
jgi:DNA-binding LytR/AlgR family response regulator